MVATIITVRCGTLGADGKLVPAGAEHEVRHDRMQRISEMYIQPCHSPSAVTLKPATVMPNQDRNSEMNSTTVAMPAILSASDQRAASNLKAGTDDGSWTPPRRVRAAAGAGALTAGAAWVAVELEPNVAPQLGQAVASSAASV